MLIEKPATILFTLAFLMPGFITMSVLGLFVPPRRTETSAAILRLLSLSFANYAVCFPLIAWILLGTYFQDHLVGLAFTLAFIGIVMPILLGILMGIGGQRDWLGKALGRLNLNAIHPVPVSWDYVFGSRTNWVFVLVTLKDGSIKAGRFGPESFASSYPEGNDLFLEAVYEIDADGAWSEHPCVESLLIASGEIRSVEFLKPELKEELENECEQVKQIDGLWPSAEDRKGLSTQGIDQGASAQADRWRERSQTTIG